MKILFISLGEFKDLSQGSVHIDMMKKFAEKNEVFLVCKTEKRDGIKTQLTFEENINVLRVRTGNIKNTSFIEKGISTVLVEPQFKHAVKKFFSNVKFDLVLYTTPPITIVNVIKFIKMRDNAKSYLMLKDIFPQNAVDLEILKKNGIKGLIYRLFRKKEKKLYEISDYIGCMSPANVNYILRENPEIDSKIVEICPNCIEPKEFEKNPALRKKYEIPSDKVIFVYGGNLGRPQGIEFVKTCLERCKDIEEAFFVIIGGGTEAENIRKFIESREVENVRFINTLPRDDYEVLAGSCDVGLVFLDYRFTIPNFPSRILSYMQAYMPVVVATDASTDMGKIVEDNKFGWACTSNDVDGFYDCILKAIEANREQLGLNARHYLEKNYSTECGYNVIMRHFTEK